MNTIDIHAHPFPESGAFVLGGSGGLGRGICLSFAHWGVPVAFTYHRNAMAAAELVAEIKALGVEAVSYQFPDKTSSLMVANPCRPHDCREHRQ